YKRAARPLANPLHTQGKAAISSGGTLVTGNGTAFRPGMVGSVIRLSDNAIRAPTSEGGAKPAGFESLVTGYVSAASIVVSDPAPQAFDAVAYTVSDRIDIEEG